MTYFFQVPWIACHPCLQYPAIASGEQVGFKGWKMWIAFFLCHFLGLAKTASEDWSSECAGYDPVAYSQPSRQLLQYILGFLSFYYRFIYNYSQVTAPFTPLTSSRVPFVWSAEAPVAFSKPKEHLTLNYNLNLIYLNSVSDDTKFCASTCVSWSESVLVCESVAVISRSQLTQ